jgi:hypothetical protein
MPPGEFMGPPPDNQPLQEGDDAGLRAELEGLLASWEEKTPNTVAGQYFQDLARVLSKYA